MMKSRYPDPIGSGGLWKRSGKNGEYFSGFLEFEKDMAPIRVDFLAFPVIKEPAQKDPPQLRIKVISWEFAPARRLYLGQTPPRK